MSISRSTFPAGQAVPATALLRADRAGAIEASLASRSRELTRDWLATAARIGQLVDLDASAHRTGAMIRRRGVPSATNLLCLALLYGPGRMPLRLIAERTAALNIARVSEPALLRRLINAATWLDHLVDQLLEKTLQALWPASAASPSGFSAILDARNLSRQRVEAARRFVIEFRPWPEALFSERQIHWLLCLRWTFVSSTLKDSPTRPADGAIPPSPLECTRMTAHLLVAIATGES